VSGRNRKGSTPIDRSNPKGAVINGSQTEMDPHPPGGRDEGRRIGWTAQKRRLIPGFLSGRPRWPRQGRPKHRVTCPSRCKKSRDAGRQAETGDGYGKGTARLCPRRGKGGKKTVAELCGLGRETPSDPVPKKGKKISSPSMSASTSFQYFRGSCGTFERNGCHHQTSSIRRGQQDPYRLRRDQGSLHTDPLPRPLAKQGFDILAHTGTGSPLHREQG